MATLGKIVSVSLSVWMAFSGVVPVRGMLVADTSRAATVTKQVQTRSVTPLICKIWPQSPICR